MKDSESADTARNPAWISSTTKMSGDAFQDCHYPVIAAVLFCEHVIVLLAAVAAFISAYKASQLKPAIKTSHKKNGRRRVRPDLALREVSL